MGKRLVSAAIAALMLASCGGGGGGDNDATKTTGSSTTSAAKTSSTTATSTTAATSKTGGGAGSSATTTVAPVPTPAAKAPANPKYPSGRFALGTYTSHTTGSATYNGTPSTVDRYDRLILERINATDLRSRDGGNGFVQVLRVSSTEVRVVTLDINLPGFVRHFDANPPVLFFPIGAQPGRSWDWKLKASKALTTVAQTSTIGPSEKLTVLGRTVNATVANVKITLGGDVSGTITLKVWLDPAILQPVRTHAVSDVRFGAFTVKSDTTSDFAGFEPA
jgi:hypothetical protein